jgi:hypothetical protein
VVWEWKIGWCFCWKGSNKNGMKAMRSNFPRLIKGLFLFIFDAILEFDKVVGFQMISGGL